MAGTSSSAYRPIEAPTLGPPSHGRPPPPNPPADPLVVAPGEVNGSSWVCVSLSSLAVIHRHPAPHRQVEAVGPTPLFMGEHVQNIATATTR